AVNEVVAVVTADEIVTRAGVDAVSAAAAHDHVRTGCTLDHVVPGRADTALVADAVDRAPGGRRDSVAFVGDAGVVDHRYVGEVGVLHRLFSGGFDPARRGDRAEAGRVERQRVWEPVLDRLEVLGRADQAGRRHRVAAGGRAELRHLGVLHVHRD